MADADGREGSERAPRGEVPGGRGGPFREEALRARTEAGARGRLLLLPPHWVTGSYWLLLAVGAGVGALLFLGRITEYAQGPAFVMSAGVPHARDARAPDADGSRPRYELWAMLPARQRARLGPSPRLLVEFEGYPRDRFWLTADGMSDRIYAPGEPPPFVRDTPLAPVGPAEPFVVVHAALPGEDFAATDGRIGYHEGMRARVDVPVARQRLLFVLAPWLAAPFEGGDGG